MNTINNNSFEDEEEIEFELDKDVKRDEAFISNQTSMCSSEETQSIKNELANYLEDLYSAKPQPKEDLVNLNNPVAIFSDEQTLETLISLNILISKNPESIKLLIETEFYYLFKDLLAFVYNNFE